MLQTQPVVGRNDKHSTQVELSHAAVYGMPAPHAPSVKPVRSSLARLRPPASQQSTASPPVDEQEKISSIDAVPQEPTVAAAATQPRFFYQ